MYLSCLGTVDTMTMFGFTQGPTLVAQLFNIKVQYNSLNLITPDQIPKSASIQERAQLLKERIDTVSFL